MTIPAPMRALASLPGGPHVIDGEVCVLGPDATSIVCRSVRVAAVGIPAPQWSPIARSTCWCTTANESWACLPLVARKQRLHDLVQGVSGVLFIGDLPADAKVFQAIVGAGLQIEGVVAKRKASTYQPGVRSPDWLKIKRPGWNAGREWKS